MINCYKIMELNDSFNELPKSVDPQFLSVVYTFHKITLFNMLAMHEI